MSPEPVVTLGLGVCARISGGAGRAGACSATSRGMDQRNDGLVITRWKAPVSGVTMSLGVLSGWSSSMEVVHRVITARNGREHRRVPFRKL